MITKDLLNLFVSTELIKTVDDQLKDKGWSDPVRTAGKHEDKTCTILKYKKNKQVVELVRFTMNDGTVQNYIFVDNPTEGIDVDEMKLFIEKMEGKNE
jgi:hypothetical protein